MSIWIQKDIKLQPKPRGFHLVHREILEHIPEVNTIKIGIAQFFIQHTSASLAINENADPTVRMDMEAYFRHSVPDNSPYFEHTLEGPDDMTAHIKSAMIGESLTIPIRQGRLALGVWQGIYLGEHRNHAGSRHVIATLNGQA